MWLAVDRDEADVAGLWATLGANPSATLVLAIVILAIVSGLLVPKWVASNWFKAWKLEQEKGLEVNRQLERLLEAQKLLNNTIEALREALARDRTP